MFWNSCLQTGAVLGGQLLAALPAAWAFARFGFRGRKALLFLYIILMMQPFQVTMVPGYLVLKQMHLLNTHLAVVLPGMFSAFPVFVMAKFFESIPGPLVEAARLDGASAWQTTRHITLPLVTPSINTTITLCVIGGFNIFDIVMSMTNGGPNGATQVISKLSYDAMRIGTMGYASAINLIQFLLIVIVISPLLGILRRREPDI